MANHPGRAPRAPMVGAKADIKPLGRVIRMLFQDYPAMLIAVMACIIISAVVGILPAIYIETITSYIEDGLRLGWDGVSGKILHALVTMVCIYLAGLACTAVYTQLMAHVTQGFLHKLRTRMFAGMQKLPIRYFDQNSRGDIMSYYTNDIDTLRQLVSQSLPQLFAAGLTVIGLLLFMFYFSIPLMLIVFLGIFCMTKVTKNVGGRSAKYFLSQQKSLGKVEGYIEEMMNGQKVVKVFCHEEAAERDFDAINEQLFSDANHAQRYANIFMPIMGNIGNILYVLTAFLGGVLICSGGNIPNLSFQNLFETGSMLAPLKIAVVASFLGMTKQFTGNVSQVSQQINAIVMALAGAERIFALMDAVDEYIPSPERDTDKPFLMPVEDVFSITGRGTVATGRVERGVVKVSDTVEIVGLQDKPRSTVVTGVEMFRKLLDQAEAGDNIGVLLRGIQRNEVERGQVLAKPGSIHPHTHYMGQVYVLTKEEGGRHTPFFNGYRPQFYFRTTDVTGNIKLPEGVEMVMPGDNVDMECTLITPIAMDEKLRFAIREGGRTVGSGVVTKILE